MVLYRGEPVNSVDANSVWESLVGTFVWAAENSVEI